MSPRRVQRKSFYFHISPWAVILDALEPFRVNPQLRDSEDLLPYLTDPHDFACDIHIQTDWTMAGTNEMY